MDNISIIAEKNDKR